MQSIATYLVDLASIIHLNQRLSHANVRPNFLTFNLLKAQYKGYLLFVRQASLRITQPTVVIILIRNVGDYVVI